MRTIEYYRHEADRQSFAARSARDAGRHADAAHYGRLAWLAHAMAERLAAEAEAAIDEAVAENIVEAAIDHSVSHDEIVHIDGDDAVCAALCIRCDDSADSDDVTEYWGVRDDGAEWRVHVRGGRS